MARSEGLQGARPWGAEAPDRLALVARDEQVAVRREAVQQLAVGGAGVLVLVGHHLREALAEPLAHVSAVAHKASQLQDQIAAVQAARLGEDPVVAGVELRELDLAPPALPLGLARGLAL